MLGGIAVLVLVWDGLLICSVFDGHLSCGDCRLWASTSSGLVVARDASTPLYHNLGICSRYDAIVIVLGV